MIGLNILVIVLVLSIPFVIVICENISEKKEAKEKAERFAEYEKLFTPDRQVYVYECFSNVFDVWDLVVIYRILKYKDGHILCHRLAVDDEKPYDYKGYVPDDIEIDSLIKWQDKVLLLNKTPFSGEVIKTWTKGKANDE